MKLIRQDFSCRIFFCGCVAAVDMEFDILGSVVYTEKGKKTILIIYGGESSNSGSPLDIRLRWAFGKRAPLPRAVQ